MNLKNEDTSLGILENNIDQDDKNINSENPLVNLSQDIINRRNMAQNIFQYSMNRELSWLNFNKRVLDESLDPLTPGFESLKFISIFTSNLEEFYRVRVGSLIDLAAVSNNKRDNKSNLTSNEQLEKIYTKTRILLDEKDQVFSKVSKDLEAKGVVDVSYKNLTKKEKKKINDLYHYYIEPILSPQIIDSHHPFPFIENNKLNIILELSQGKEKKIGLLLIPDTLKRYIPLNRNGLAFIRIENVIEALISKTFNNYTVDKVNVFNVVRNADINIEEYLEDGDENYLTEDFKTFMKNILKKRNRLQAVALITNKELNKHLKSFLMKNLSLNENQVFVTSAPLIMGYVFDLENTVKGKKLDGLLYPPFSPQHNTMLVEDKPLIDQILKKDLLFIYPYEDIDEFIRLLDEASVDPRVFSIKMTVYRLAKNSKIIRYLLKAIDNGKEVTVLMELQARFDEESNINYSDILLEAGCKIIYGISGYKVHSKVCQIDLKIDDEIKHITQIGTGNYNEKTSRQYTDLSYITSNDATGADAFNFFKNLSIGNLNGHYAKLLVSPNSFKSTILDLIDDEITKGSDGKIFFKFNSFTDKDIIIKLAEASMAGVDVKLLIRGISCLRPGVKSYTENIKIKSIVGRFLEHSRIYVFGKNNRTKVFIGSADLMTRNTERRVEVTVPIQDSHIKEKILQYLDYQWKDNVKARDMNFFGEYEVTFKGQDYLLDSQDYYIKMAYEKAKEAEENKTNLIDTTETTKDVIKNDKGLIKKLLKIFKS